MVKAAPAGAFDIEKIHESGQCFRMKKAEDGSFIIPAADRCLVLREEGGLLSLSCTEEEYEAFWRGYLDLETDYSVYVNAVDRNDEYLLSAVDFGLGLRILRQDPWEMVISFIISQQNNIKRIRKSIEDLCIRYGEKKQLDTGEEYHAFPKPAALAALSAEELSKSGLGYRSKYVLAAAAAVADGSFCPEELKNMEYKEAREALKKLYGVGDKVADCICLFGFHMLCAFPVDTHIRQILQKQYPDGFPFERYAGFEGLVQQYMFYYDLKCPLGSGAKDV